MRPKNALKLLKPLLQAHSFTSKEARLLGVSSSTLAYYVKQNALISIGHGVYRSAHATDAADFRWEDLIEAMQRTTGGVICLTSALSLYQLTEEMPSQHWIAIRNNTMHRSAVTTKVVRMRNLTLGKTTIKIGNITLPIFDRERTIVDAFRYLSQETAVKALKIGLGKKGSDKIDIEKMRGYAKILRVQIEPYLIAMTI